MDYLWYLLGATVLAGGGFGAYKFFQNPASYLKIGQLIWNALAPKLFKRMTPEEEKRFQDVTKAGATWDPVTKTEKKWDKH